MLDSSRDVVRCLVTYADWWQPSSSSILRVGVARRTRELPEGIRPGLIETLDERSELCRRVGLLDDRDRRILFLWYVRQLHVDDIASDIGVSRRQCFRRRADAIRTIVKLGEPDAAA